ncbi:MAG: DUF4837 family protein [Salinivirgaceae bacterium]|nr:DUF4837 family protein [Salinivirgaceae bacterium]
MIKLKFFIFTIIAITFMSCNNRKVTKSLLPSASGRAGEVLIIMDKNQWQETPGQGFKKLLQEDTPGLPQSEPLFDVVNIPQQAFSELFRIHRNIIITNISPSAEKFGINVEYNKWANPQMVITIVAKTRSDFMEIFDENNQKILSLLFKAENVRLTKRYKKYAEQPIIKKVEQRTGVHLTIPKGYSYDVDTNNFIWISHETSQMIQGLFIYYYDYKDSTDFTLDKLIKSRDKYLKLYVPGENRGSHMATELQVFPTFRSYKMNESYTAEVRGLWKVEGDFMGGPFVSVSQIDEKRNRIVTVEGFVYAPKYDKRNYVRELEAILHSMEFVKEKPKQKAK